MTDHDRRLIATLIRELQALRDDLRRIADAEPRRSADQYHDATAPGGWDFRG
jgi:hypothetical protein